MWHYGGGKVNNIALEKCRKRLFRRPKNRWEDSIKMIKKEKLLRRPRQGWEDNFKVVQKGKAC